MEEERLGGYTLAEAIETVGHTVTQRATRDGADGRPVRVRRLRPGVELSDAVRASFRAEHDMLALVQHPLLTELIEAGEHDGRPYVVLRERGGVRLVEVLKADPRVTPPSAMAIGIDVARAVAELHRHGIVHGGLSPDHVELDPRGNVCLHGFDVIAARRQAKRELDDPEAMAPEQHVGGEPDERSDVFQLGVLLYRMLAGRPPFKAEGTTGVAHRIRHDAPPELPRAVRRVPGLESVVLRCLRKRPRDRFADAASVAAALTRVLRTESSLPLDLLVTRALADVGMAEPFDLPADGAVPRTQTLSTRRLNRLALPLVGLCLALAVVLIVTLRGGGGAIAPDPGVRGVEQKPARVKILVRPWAEVHIDGTHVDTTPIGYPVEVTPGHHVVLLRHPHAPDVTRPIDVIPGQTVLIDVAMEVMRPSPDAGPGDAGTPEELSP